MIQQRSEGLPPQGIGIADWYVSTHKTVHRCFYCGDVHEEPVGVLEYLPDMDFTGEQTRKHPGWKTLGWLAWWECPACERQELVPVSARRVALWGKRIGPWHR